MLSTIISIIPSIAGGIIFGLLSLLWIKTIYQLLALGIFYLINAIIFFMILNRLKNIWLILLASASICILYSYLAYDYQNKLLPKSLEQQNITLIGEIITVINQAKQLKFILSVTGSPNWPPKTRILLNWYNKPDSIILTRGQQWRFNVRLTRPHGYANPGSFDFEKYCFSQQIHAVGRVLTNKHQRYELLNNQHIPWRTQQQQKLNRYLSGSNLSLLQGLFTGDKSYINPAQWKVLQRTGTGHLLAISGLHLGVVAAIVSFFAKIIWFFIPVFMQQRLHYNKFNISLIITVTGFYVWFTGSSAATVRAWLMVLLFGISLFSYQMRNFGGAWRILITSWVLGIIIQPLAVFSCGFWLSYLAVGLIIYCYGNLLWNFKNKFQQLLGLQWLLFIGLLPFNLFWFKSISISGLLVNLIAVPWVSTIIVPSLLSGCWSFADLNMHWLWQFMECSIWDISKNFTINTPELISLIMGSLLLLAPRGLPLRWLGIICYLPLFYPYIDRPNYGEFRLHMLDVGQGLAIVIQTKQHVLLYDAGLPKVGNMVLKPFFQNLHINKIDRCIISHIDLDHVGGLVSISKLVKQIITSEPKYFSHYLTNNVIDISDIEHIWSWDGVTFELFSIKNNILKKLSKQNNRSCILKISTSNQNYSVLLTGDIESVAEHQLLQEYNTKLSSQILQVPHHGSKTSSSLEFIKSVNPAYSLVSAGYNNQYHHPHSQIMERYTNNGIATYCTSHHGRVMLVIKPGGIQTPQLERQIKQKIWNYD